MSSHCNRAGAPSIEQPTHFISDDLLDSFDELPTQGLACGSLDSACRAIAVLLALFGDVLDPTVIGIGHWFL